ncbi:glycosyltransferase family 4 protein [Crassaminicella indica]|uniref:Glycosyltransferase family 4 protein n=1 Tax=Crassaminicella indica TaxID=2855394 RepID=A0ABX8RCB8_9CLOT|nr:glycosyltransferase family 4 protein [Crassaminicella indica]QXM06690.1 glycosyltransferase family 4 protein [Crassaminicella indica]
MKPKILEVSAIDLTIYKFILPLMRELKKNGFDVSCAAAYMGAADKIEAEGFKVYHIDIERKIAPISNIKTIIQLYKIIKKEKIDIIHVHTPIAAVLGRIAAKLAGVKHVIYTVHGFYMSNKFFYHIEKFMAKYFTDYIFTVNNEDLTFALENHFISSKKIMNINSVGIDTDKFDPQKIDIKVIKEIRKSFQIKAADKVIGFVGRVVKEKGVLDLINAFIYLNKQKENIKLLIVGSWNLGERDNSTKFEIDQLIEKYNLKDKVIFTGHREDIKEFLSIMDIFVLPSYREGMPVSLLEAMSMERCVVATDIRGCRDEVDEATGILYKAGDVEKLASILNDLLNSEIKRREFGKNARKRVQKLFEQQQVIEKQIKLFKKLL